MTVNCFCACLMDEIRNVIFLWKNTFYTLKYFKTTTFKTWLSLIVFNLVGTLSLFDDSLRLDAVSKLFWSFTKLIKVPNVEIVSTFWLLSWGRLF